METALTEADLMKTALTEADLTEADLPSLLDIPPGVTALIGGGGKTSLMEVLADRLPGTVLLCTTTHIRRPARFPIRTEADPGEIRAALDRHRVVCAGTAADAGKLTAPQLSFPVLASLADYVLTEADGSRGLPLKAHAPWEPVIAENAARVILVAGLDGIGKPIRETCHRPDLYASLAGTAAGGGPGAALEPVSTDSVVTPRLAARVMAAEGYGDCVFLNKAERGAAVRYGEELAGCLAELRSVPVVCGSLRNGTFRRLC